MPRTVLGLVLLLPSLLGAAEYVVTAEPGEEGSGKPGRPFRSIERAFAQLQAGDTLTVLPGTYTLARGLSLYGRTGEPGKPIVVRGAEGAPRPVIDASATPKTSNGVATSGIFIGNAAWIELRRLHVTGAPGHGICIWGAPNVRIDDCEVSANVVNGVFASRAGGPPLQGVVVARTHAHDNCTFNRVHNDKGLWGQGIGLSGCIGGVVEDCVSERNFGEGIDLYNAVDCRMSRNVSRDNFSCMLYLDNAQRCVVERNLVISTGAKEYFRDGNPAGGIVVADEPRAQPIPNAGNIIRNNIVVRTYSGVRYGAYGQAAGLNTCQILGNTFVEPLQFGLQIDKAGQHTGNVVAGNVFIGQRRHVFSPGGLGGFAFSCNAWWGGAGDAVRGQGDVNGDPRLADPAGTAAADFAPSAGSPLLNAWATAAGVAEDFAGLARPQGGICDIGAWEAPDAKTLAVRRKEAADAEAAAKPKREAPAAPRMAKPTQGALAAFTQRTRERALEAARTGRGPRFVMQATRTEALVEGGEDGDVQLRIGPSTMAVAWRSLAQADYAGMAVDLARSGAPADQALAAFWLRAQGNDAEARDALLRAGAFAAEVERSFDN